jgi:hypothetical protein
LRGWRELSRQPTGIGFHSEAGKRVGCQAVKPIAIYGDPHTPWKAASEHVLLET